MFGVPPDRLGKLVAQRAAGDPVEGGEDLRHHLAYAGRIGAGEVAQLGDELGDVVLAVTLRDALPDLG